MGAVLSEDTIEKFGAFDDSVQRLKQGSEAAQRVMGTVLLPQLQTLADDGVSLLGDFTSGLVDAGGDFDKITVVLSETVGGIANMILGSLPFTLYVATLRGHRRALIKDHQVQGFLGFLVVAWILVGSWLCWHSGLSWWDALRIVAVNVTSVVTTTGIAVGDYTLWGSFSVLLFFYLTFIGGCSGSTAGGLKIFRFQVAASLLISSLKQLIHPRATISKKYNGHPIDEEIVRSLLTFSFFFSITIAVIALLLSLIGLDWTTALSAAATAVCNVGPGLGTVIGPAGNFASLPDSAKWLLTLGMLLGRLEILTVLVLVAPAFWRF